MSSTCKYLPAKNAYCLIGDNLFLRKYSPIQYLVSGIEQHQTRAAAGIVHVVSKYVVRRARVNAIIKK